jgi:hypothetical protein
MKRQFVCCAAVLAALELAPASSRPVAVLAAQSAPAAPAPQAAEPAKPILTLEGPVSLITVLIKPEKTADFEMVLDRLRDALGKSENPARRRQAAGWFLYKGAQPVQGNAVYVMRIEPVITGEEYDISRLIAEVFPTEVQEIFARYRDAFAGRAIAGLAPMPAMSGQ